MESKDTVSLTSSMETHSGSISNIKRSTSNIKKSPIIANRVSGNINQIHFNSNKIIRILNTEIVKFNR